MLVDVETPMGIDELTRSITDFRTFLPAKDFETSKRFYSDLGFELRSLGPDLAHVGLGPHAFLLQAYYVKEWAENFMMHVVVTNLNGWWEHIASLDLESRYSVRPPRPPKLERWGLNVAYVFDPTGVLWHFAERPAKA